MDLSERMPWAAAMWYLHVGADMQKISCPVLEKGIFTDLFSGEVLVEEDVRRC